MPTKKTNYTNFFKKIIESRPHICEESGIEIYNISSWECAHIFYKRVYKSVAKDERNIVILTKELHRKFDHYIDLNDFENLEREFPNSWPIVCERVRELIPLVTENKKLKMKFLDYLGI